MSTPPLPPNCPKVFGPRISAPCLIEAVTFSAKTGRVNIHLDDSLSVVYTTIDPVDHQIQSLLAQAAIGAYVHGKKVTITYQDGDNPGGGSTLYCARYIVRLTLEGDRGELIPWDVPRDEPPAP